MPGFDTSRPPATTWIKLSNTFFRHQACQRCPASSLQAILLPVQWHRSARRSPADLFNLVQGIWETNCLYAARQARSWRWVGAAQRCLFGRL